MADGIKKINENILKDGRVIAITKELSASNFEGGTLYIHPSQGTLKYNNVSASATKSWQKFRPINLFDEKSITRPLLEDEIINSAKLENLAVTTSKIENLAVTKEKLAINSVTTEKITNLHVTTDKLANLSVDESKIKNSSVTTQKLANASVTKDKLGLSSVLNNHISDNTIRNEKLFNKTITHEKISNLTIIEDLLAKNSVTETKIKNLSIKSNHIDNNQVLTKHILDRNVTGDKIATNSLKDSHMIINEINGNKLRDGSIKNSKYEDLSITGNKVQDGTLDIDKLDTATRKLIEESIRVEGPEQTATVKGNLKVNGNIVATGNITGAKVFNQVFADIAEGYFPVEDMEVGDAVCLCKEGGLKVEKLNNENEYLFLGFVSENYAACYGASEEELKIGKKIAIALKGRIPVKIQTHNLKVGHILDIYNGKVTTLGYSKTEKGIAKVLDIIDDSTALILV